MAETKNIAVLFDFDGVVVDTETQYSVFWHKMGVDYLGMEDLPYYWKLRTWRKDYMHIVL